MFRYIFKLLNGALEQVSTPSQQQQCPADFSAPQRTTERPVSPAPKPSAAAAAPNANKIQDSAYQDRTDLTEFTVPEGVRSIGMDAFRNCRNLQKITLPETLLEIDNRAFFGCASLTEITIPYSVRKIGNNAFSDCTALRSFRFPKGMEGAELESSILQHCAALETVELPDRLSGQLNSVFSRCDSLRTVILPEGITEIGAFAFYGCDMLERIEIPSSVTTLGHRAFQGCKSLREILIPDTVQTIDGDSVFRQCTNLEWIRLPVGVTFNLVRDEDDDDPDNVKSVAVCFFGCNALKTVMLGSREFRLQSPLDDDTLLRMYKELAADGDPAALEIVQKQQQPAEKPVSAAPIPHTTIIPYQAYKGRTDLTEFTVPEGVQTIGDCAFQDCSNLQTITLPETLLEIGDHAFYGCSALTEIVIPDSVRSIGKNAFEECSKLRSFRFPKGMNGKELANSLFSFCKALETVEFPERMSGSLYRVFIGCENLRSIRLPEGITEIGEIAFCECENLEQIEIPSTVTALGEQAFCQCVSLREIVLPDSVRTIDTCETFSACLKLERIRLPIGVQFIEKRKSAKSLKGVDLCFVECGSLKTVILGSREFHLQAPADDEERGYPFDNGNLLLMYAELAADGNPTALEIVRNNRQRAMELLDKTGNQITKEKLIRNL